MKYNKKQIRSFTIENINEDKTFISMSLSSETPVLRSFGNEILLHNVENIDMSRTIGSGLPLMVNHNDLDLPVGRLKNVRLDPDTKKLRGDAYFSGRTEAQAVRQDILDGVLSDVSIGYRILDYKVKKSEIKDNPNDFLVTRWLPYECSLVGIPADPNVGIGRSDTEDIEIDEEELLETELQEAEANVEALEAVEASETPADTSDAQMEPGETPAGQESVSSDANTQINPDDEEKEEKEDTEDNTNERSLDIIDNIEINAKTELLNTELLALRNIAISQKLKSEVEIDLILKNTTDIKEARKLLLNTTVKEQSILLVKENRNMLTNEQFYRSFANAVKGEYSKIEEDAKGIFIPKGERSFTADLFTRADTYPGDTVASNMTTGQYGASSVFQQNIGFL